MIPTTSPARRWRVTPKTFEYLAIAAVACYALLVVTGGGVRLTGSGLGCRDWPTCSKGSFIAGDAFHPLVEFSNRMVTIAVSIVSVAAWIGALRRQPRRRDLSWLSGGLVIGLVAQIVLGGLVVLFKLNPYLVALHFVLTFAVLAVALVMWHRCRLPDGPRQPVVQPEVVWLARLLLLVLCGLVLAGTVASGSGPHAGAPGAKRIDLSFRDAAELHADVALLLIGLTLATLFALHIAKAPATVQRRARFLLELLFVQGVIGYSQYFLHDAPGVVEVHLAGATSIWCTAVLYYLSLFRTLPAPAAAHETAPAGATLDEAVAGALSSVRAVPPGVGDAPA